MKIHPADKVFPLKRKIAHVTPACPTLEAAKLMHLRGHTFGLLLQELRWAVQYDKNIVLVRETDERHGGIEMNMFLQQLVAYICLPLQSGVALQIDLAVNSDST
eukprot:509145-Amphidinium_carterae.1